MTKTLLIDEPKYWDIKDAQTILEKKRIKYTLPEILNVIVPSTEDIVKKIEKIELKNCFICNKSFKPDFNTTMHYGDDGADGFLCEEHSNIQMEK